MGDGGLVVATALIAVVVWNININPVFKTVAIEITVLAVLLLLTPFRESWMMKIAVAAAIVVWNTRLHPTVKNVVIGVTLLIVLFDYLGFVDEVRNLFGFL